MKYRLNVALFALFFAVTASVLSAGELGTFPRAGATELSRGCFPEPSPGYWDCMMPGRKFFDGQRRFSRVNPESDMGDSFVLQFNARPLPGENLGLLFASESIAIYYRWPLETINVTLIVSPGDLDANVSAPMPVDQDYTVSLRVTELEDSVAIELSLNGEVVAVDIEVGQLIPTSDPGWVGALYGTWFHFHGAIGQVAIGSDVLP